MINFISFYAATILISSKQDIFWALRFVFGASLSEPHTSRLLVVLCGMRFFIWRTLFELSRFSKCMLGVLRVRKQRVNGLNYGRGLQCIANYDTI